MSGGILEVVQTNGVRMGAKQILGFLPWSASVSLDKACQRQTEFAAPIQYSIPTRKWNHYRPLRQRPSALSDFAPLIPGDARTYNYTEEAEYLKMYASSLYCITRKKGGWDCLRHYEILLAGCVPYFLDIELLPSLTMVHFPRQIIQVLMKLPGVPSQEAVKKELLLGRRPRLGENFPRDRYMELRGRMLKYVEHFTLSSHRASELIPDGGFGAVLVHSKSTESKPVDYLRELLVVGLLELRVRVQVNFNISHIFADFDVTRQALVWKESYGRGFLYERALPAEAKRLVSFYQNEPKEPVIYIKTTYNNQQYPVENLLRRSPDLHVDGNDLWAPHPEPGASRGRWLRRELTDCRQLTRPAQLLLATLDSGDLWNCQRAPTSHLCPDLHGAALLWLDALRLLPELGVHQRGWRNEEKHQQLLGDVEDYLRTPAWVPDFVEKFLAIAENCRQFLDAYRSRLVTERRPFAVPVQDLGVECSGLQDLRSEPRCLQRELLSLEADAAKAAAEIRTDAADFGAWRRLLPWLSAMGLRDLELMAFLREAELWHMPAARPQLLRSAQLLRWARGELLRRLAP
ncbi:unnamed protein product [Effrenium voratum]|uniref:Uncharacterized protein n=1 Tax=Effrenium voratum TaxID=2562239 RepID=A0AA36J065_9DINO|nr:unnamed protein product [Effrenium voratum]CAJ1421462.1 unnamed protein product [Effrenium voratum]